MIEELLTALVVGLLLAFAFQVLLTSLGVAIGMSVLAVRTRSPRSNLGPAQDAELNSELASTGSEAAAMDVEQETSREPDSSGVQLGFWAGFGVLLTVNSVLFAACFLASRLTQAQSPLTGAIEGLVIWSAYLLILIWLSSTAVSSVVGSLLSITTGGFRSLVRPVKALFDAKEPAAITAAEMRAAVRQEVQAVFDPEQLQSLIRTELQQLPLQETAPQAAAVSGSGRQFHPNLEGSEGPTERATEAFTQSEVDAILAALPREFGRYLLEADKLTPKRVDRRLQQMLQAVKLALPDSTPIPEIARSRAMRLLMQREDLSEKEREKILNRIENTWNKFKQLNQDSDKEQFGNQIVENENNGFYANGKPQSAIQQVTYSALKTLAEQLPDSVTHHPAVEPLMQQLPEMMEQAGQQIPTGASLAMVTMALMKAKDLLPEDGIELQQLRQILDRLIEQSGVEDVGHAVVEQVDQLRDRSMQQIEQVQQTVQEQVDRLKTQTGEQLQATQRAATIAAWWLFLTVLTGAISAAVAGAIANLSFVSRL